MLELSKVEQMVQRSVANVFKQYKALEDKNMGLFPIADITQINTSIRYNTEAGVHVHTGAKLTIKLHAAVSERDGDLPRKASMQDNSRVQI